MRSSSSPTALPGPGCKVREQAVVGDKAYTRWSLVREEGGKELRLIEAVGESTLDEQGRIVRHVDDWDSVQGVYGRIPVLGRLLKRIRRAVGAGWEPALPPSCVRDERGRVP